MDSAHHLAMETSGATGTLAVGPGGSDAPAATESLPKKRRGHVDLMPAVADLLLRAHPGAQPQDLGFVSLALGPGSFTGLRVAVATAKMLALTLGVKLIGIPTLDLLRAQHPDAVIALNVKRGTAWSAGPGLEPALRPLEALHASGRPLVGDLEGALCPPDADVAVLYRLAHARIAAHDYDDPLVLAPAYIREPEAVTLWDERTASSKA